MPESPPTDRTPAQRLAIFALASILVFAIALLIGNVSRGPAHHRSASHESSMTGTGHP